MFQLISVQFDFITAKGNLDFVSVDEWNTTPSVSLYNLMFNHCLSVSNNFVLNNKLQKKRNEIKLEIIIFDRNIINFLDCLMYFNCPGRITKYGTLKSALVIMIFPLMLLTKCVTQNVHCSSYLITDYR